MSTYGDSHSLHVRPPSSEHSYVAPWSFGVPVEKKNVAVELAVVADGPHAIVVCGTTSVVPVASANGDSVSVSPQTSPRRRPRS